MQTMTMNERRQGGFSLFNTLGTLALVFALFLTFGGHVTSALWNYYIMRDLAVRVTTEYANLPLSTVKQRVDFEFSRSNIVVPEDTFQITKLDKGYRVEIDYHIPMEFTIGKFTLAKGKEIVLAFATES